MKDSRFKWSEEEIDILKEYYEKGFSIEQISKIIGKSKSAIKQRLSELKLKRKMVSANKWKDGELKFLKEYYHPEKMSIQEIAETLNRTENAVKAKANSLGLKYNRNSLSKKGYKYCAKCGYEHPFENFHKHKNRADGLHVYCKYCMSQFNKERKEIKKQKGEGKNDSR